MSTPRFYVSPDAWGKEIALEGQEAKHLSQVLRIRQGEEVCLVDGRGRSGSFRVEEIQKHKTLLKLIHEEHEDPPQSRAVMALAFSKAIRRHFFMEKAAELGAHAIWLWQGDRSQGKLTPDLADSCERQITAGAKQCGNTWFTEVKILAGGVAGLIKESQSADRRILPWEHQDTASLLNPEIAGRPGTTVYVIGPEGGFSEKELLALDDAGFTRVSLGRSILRCETAATLCLGLHWWASHLPQNFQAGK